MAKNAANVHASIQISDPVPTVSEHGPEPVEHGSTVTFSGAALDKASVDKVEVLDAQGKAVEDTKPVQSTDKIEFTAPAKPGDYTLVVTPKKGEPIQRKFTVH